MATHPNPDYNSTLMKQNHGTLVLITNPASDRILREAEKKEMKARKEVKDSWTI
jgi:hypothetical protein